MAKLKVPYFQWRSGRPRWSPGPGVRALGFKGVDLKDSAGNWLGKGDAIDKAEELNTAVDAVRRSTEPSERALPKSPRCCEALWEEYRKSPRFTDKLAAKTKRDYINKAGIFVADFGACDVKAIDVGLIEAWWERLYRERGHAMANGCLAVARIILEHGRRKGWRKDNPAVRLGVPGVAPRVVVYEPEEAALMVTTADTLLEGNTGFQSIADAFVLALHQGQREGDLLRLRDDIAETGRMFVRQSKRGALVSVKLTRHARGRALRALDFKRDAGVTAMALLLNERTMRPYKNTDEFYKRFKKVRVEGLHRARHARAGSDRIPAQQEDVSGYPRHLLDPQL